MTTSHFEALYFTSVYYTAIGNTKVFHREHREHVWRMLSHIASYISIVVTFFLFEAIEEKYRQSKKMDKPLF